MARWEPGATERLQQAAYELFRENGYEQTTVKQIAGRAGVTARTFFRHFTDKREVLFAGTEQLVAALRQSIFAAPKGASPFEAVMMALEAIAPHLERPRPGVRERRALIAAHPELRERELNKLTTLCAAAIEALRALGASEPAARLAAEAGITIFRVGFDRWLDASSGALAQSIRRTRKELATMSATRGRRWRPTTRAR
ncbi:MAG TPA: helix-turn-helix domain-containing protein [Burkholderiales bacterium]|nr:helix-turn-helix domain-containing protein [Burkholderiales bacterium]